MAQQFQSPETYAVGQQLTAARLNNMVNNAVPLPGLITDRTAITSNTVASDDKILIYDASASALKSSNVSDILGSGVAINTGGISYSGQDIQINVSDSTPITTASFVSADGITVTVTATAHGFSPGGTNLIEISGAPSTYNGIFVFSYVNANTFTYTTFFTGTIVTSPTVITVVRKGAIRNASSIVTNSHLSVTQQSEFRGTMYAKGNVNITGALNCAGTVNITGALQTKGVPVLVLYEVKIDGISNMVGAGNGSTVTTHATQNNQVRGAGGAGWWSSQGFTHYNETIIVPAGEQWEVEYSPIEIIRDTDDSSNFVALLNGNTNFDLQGQGLLRYAGFTFKTHFNLATGTHTVLWKSVIVSGSGADALYMNVYNNCHRIVRKYKVS